MRERLEASFSNRVELLYEKLRSALFLKQAAPFERRMIIVPSGAMKSWLMRKMADDAELGIATGIEIGFLDETLKKLYKILNLHSSKPLLSTLEIAFALEQNIRRTLTTDSQERDQWQPLLKYLNIEHFKPKLTKKADRRLTALCSKLAALFVQYGTYAGPMAAEWEAGTCEGWQQQLWRTLFSERWEYPYRMLRSLIDQESLHLQRRDIQIHLFGMSFIPRIHHDFFVRISREVPVHYYTLSPCQAFWSDLCSDRERHRLESYWKERGISETQLIALDEYLRDRNPLLANFGKIGREMAKQIEESNALTEEAYALSGNLQMHAQYEEVLSPEIHLENTQAPATMLEAIQADLVCLRNPETTPKVPLKDEDRSIQVHAAMTRMREIEVLYDALLGIIHHSNPPIYPHEIIVMAPDIRDYSPYIKAVFGHSESLLQAQVNDFDIPALNRSVQGFLSLLKVAESRWEAGTLAELFEIKAFQQQQQLSVEEVETIKEWIKRAEVRWGTDAAHRNELLQRSHCRHGMDEGSAVGTWENAFDRLLAGFSTTYIAGISESSLPLEFIDSTQAELLGKWIGLMRTLKQDLNCLTNGSALSVVEWAHYLHCLYESYFGEEEEDSALSELIATFRQAGLKLGPEPLPFSTIRHHLDSALHKPKELYLDSNLNAVRFCSLLPMRTIPAAVIAVVGMEEGAYPRRTPLLSLNLMQEHSKTDFCPSQTDYDRFLFLETLLSARRHLLFTYRGYSAEDGKEQPPSLLVTELLSYMDKAFEIGNKKPSTHCFRRHPFHSFDKSYFTPNSEFHSYSSANYKAAAAVYNREKKPSESFLDAFSISNSKPSHSENIVKVSIRDLIACAKNPIKLYFNKTLGIFLDRVENRTWKNEEEFHLSTLQSFLLKANAFKQPLEQILEQARLEGKLPIGPFKAAAVNKIAQEIKTLKSNLEELGVGTDKIFDIHCSELVTEPVQDASGNWQLPTLCLPYRDFTVQISGNLPEITPQGLVAPLRDDKTDIIKIWPQFLILDCLTKNYGLPIESQLLLLKGKGKIKQAFLDNPKKTLEHYLDYYFSALEHPSPLIPEWTPHFMNSDPKHTQDKINETLSNPFSPIYNDYLHWALRGKQQLSAEKIIEQWQPLAQLLYADLYRNWYPGKDQG